MDNLDGANSWEVCNCRIKKNFQIPAYDTVAKLAHRSLGHALGPIAILFVLGYDESSKEVKYILEFFSYYLAARQLDDEAHDWEEDLQKGHINAVVSRILRKAEQKHIPFKAPHADMDTLRELFWYEVITGVSQDMLSYIDSARSALSEIPIITDTSLLEKLLCRVERSAKKALKEREETIMFLDAYEAKVA